MEKVDRQHPVEQDPQIRRTNFDAVESNFTDEQASLEASRCLHCKNAKCVQGCPVNIQIPDFIAAIKEKKIKNHVVHACLKKKYIRRKSNYRSLNSA